MGSSTLSSGIGSTGHSIDRPSCGMYLRRERVETPRGGNNRFLVALILGSGANLIVGGGLVKEHDDR